MPVGITPLKISIADAVCCCRRKTGSSFHELRGDLVFQCFEGCVLGK